MPEKPVHTEVQGFANVEPSHALVNKKTYDFP